MLRICIFGHVWQVSVELLCTDPRLESGGGANRGMDAAEGVGVEFVTDTS